MRVSSAKILSYQLKLEPMAQGISFQKNIF
jgi:hypothetical protein